MKPEFTETEKYLIAHIKSQSSKPGISVISPDLLCLFVALAVGGFALYSSDNTWLIVSIIILAWNTLKNSYALKIYSPLYVSIFKKYEATIQQLSLKEDQHQD
ncbi:MAG: hypothetical protein ACI9E1_001051 [Cryomorphaceae bacterium]|jgi:hypothetical protein